MDKLTPWIHAARLRTLPLAISGIITGAALAWFHAVFSWLIAALALLTALLLQILSNFANDYGDFVKGTDNDARVGPLRTLQSGALSPKQMKKAMVYLSILSFISGACLLFVAGKANLDFPWAYFLLLGLGAIAAAVFYTVGKKAYGYYGMGDLMVFVFFGLASVMGAYYLFAAEFSLDSLILAIGMGALSAGVLNLNNMRDIDNDTASGKRTLAASLGFKKAKIYHAFLVLIAIICVLMVAVISAFSLWSYLVMALPLLLLLKDVWLILNTENKAQLDPFLKKLSLATFALSLSLLLAFGLQTMHHEALAL